VLRGRCTLMPGRRVLSVDEGFFGGILHIPRCIVNGAFNLIYIAFVLELLVAIDVAGYLLVHTSPHFR
jgi:hypothetical protein